LLQVWTEGEVGIGRGDVDVEGLEGGKLVDGIAGEVGVVLGTFPCP